MEVTVLAECDSSSTQAWQACRNLKRLEGSKEALCLRGYSEILVGSKARHVSFEWCHVSTEIADHHNLASGL